MDDAILHIVAQPSIGWLMIAVAVWTTAVAVLVLALVVCGPPLWRAAREWL